MEITKQSWLLPWFPVTGAVESQRFLVILILYVFLLLGVVLPGLPDVVHTAQKRTPGTHTPPSALGGLMTSPPSALSSPTLCGLTLPWLLASFLWPFFSLPIKIHLFSLGVLSLSVLRTFLLCFSALTKRRCQWDGTQEFRSKISE